MAIENVPIETVEWILTIIVIIAGLLSLGKYRYENGLSPHSPKYKEQNKN